MSAGAPETPRALDEQLRAEQRQCPQCAYLVVNPLTDRCPRCFALVPRVEVACGSCTHQGNCDFHRAYLSHNTTQNSHSDKDTQK